MAENMAAKVTKAFFDSKGLFSEFVDEMHDKLSLSFKMDNREPMRIIVFFAENNTSCKIRAYSVAKFPQEKMERMYKICNDLNFKFAWIKFYVDESDNTITADDDAVIQLDSCGDEVYRCCIQMAQIVDEAYPTIMKGIWND